MRLKPRTVPVIAFSSAVIVSVLALTMFGFYAYIEWKESNAAHNYKLALYELKGHLFEKFVIVSLRAKIGEVGTFRGKPIVEGTIKNTSNKKIYSLKLKITFHDKEHRALYVDTFYPVGLEFESLLNLSSTTKNYLRDGDAISFKHQLRNCPPRVMGYLKSQLKFAKVEGAEPFELGYKIEGLDIR